MQLQEDWKLILTKAWSVKFNIAAAIFAALEVIVSLIQPESIPNGVFASIAGTVSLLATVVRVLAQQELSNGTKTETTSTGK